MVNRNCGAGPYVKEDESNNLEDLKNYGTELDKQQLRWVIEDSQNDDKIVQYCAIHKEIVKQSVSFT